MTLAVLTNGGKDVHFQALTPKGLRNVTGKPKACWKVSRDFGEKKKNPSRQKSSPIYKVRSSDGNKSLWNPPLGFAEAVVKTLVHEGETGVTQQGLCSFTGIQSLPLFQFHQLCCEAAKEQITICKAL